MAILSECDLLQFLCSSPPVSEFLEQYVRRFCVLFVGQAKYQRHHSHASDTGARQYDVRGGAPLGIAD